MGETDQPKKASGWIPALIVVVLIVGGFLGWRIYQSDQLRIKISQHEAKYHHPLADDCDNSNGCAIKDINVRLYGREKR